MPIPVETLWNIKRLNKVFAVSALAWAGSMVWMLVADFKRPWRDFQTQYFDIQSAVAHFDWLNYQTESAKQAHQKLRDDVRSAEYLIKQKAKQEKELLDAERKVVGELQAASLDYGNLKAQIQVTEFQFEEHKTLHGPDDARTIGKKQQLADEKKRLGELQASKENLDDRQRTLKRQLKQFYAPLDDARKQLAAFEKKLNDAARNDTLYGKRGSLAFGIVPARAVFNMPLLDFAVPKGVAGREEIKQVVLPDIRAEMNFAQSYSTDRCTTCHIGIDNPLMTREAFADRLHSALAAINEIRKSEGKKPLDAPAPPAQAGGGFAPTFLAFNDMTIAQKDDYLKKLAAIVNVYLKEQGRAPIEYGHPLLAHPDLELFVTPDSPHPMAKMGCTVCHEGNGQETDFTLASHTPATHKQEHEWEHRYYKRNLGVPETTLHVAHEFWERPMLLSKHTAASCTKCHTRVGDIERRDGEVLPAARTIATGQELYVNLGCINCHAAEGLNDSRQVGPDLSHVATKLTDGFMHRWIEYPKNFRPSTRMPHAFLQENNLPSSKSPEDPDPVLRTQTEITAITHYLTTFSKPYQAFDPPADMKGDAKRGEELFTALGCLACHANLDAKDPNDEQGRSFGERWIVADLVDAGAKADDALAQYKKMSHNERVHYAYRNLTPERRQSAQASAETERRAAEAAGRDPDPKKLYVPAEFTRFAPELGAVGTKLVPNADDAEQQTRARRWMYDWLREPRHYSSYTKMPRMFRDNYYWQATDDADRRKKNDQDIVDLGEYLLSLRHDTFKPEPFPRDERHQAEQERLVLTLLAGQNTDAVARAILHDEKADPSDANGQLSERIIKGVAKTFGEGEQGVQAASEVVARQDLQGRQMLFLGSKMISHYGCYACHSIPGFEGATRPGTEMTTWARKLLSQLDFAFFSSGFEEDREIQKARFGSLFPESAEFEQLIHDAGGNPEIDVRHTHQSFAYHKLRNPRVWDRAKIKKPYDKLKMPNFFLTEDETISLVTFLLSRQAPLVQKAVQIDYESGPAGKIANGRALMHELNCTGCHAIEGNAATVHQYFIKPDPASGELSFDVTNAPPNLYGEGAKIQYPWLFGFLNDVEMLRPWLKIRMPSFYLDHAQTTALIEYFAGLSQKDAAELGKRLAAVHGWIDTTRKTAQATGEGAKGEGSSEQPAPAAQPGADWFTQPALAKAADWLGRFTLRNKLTAPFDFDTSAAKTGAEAREALVPAFEKVLERTGFIGNLQDVAYPFSGAPHALVSNERYASGKSLLLELKCLACHVAGDPKAPGTTLEVKAPNLALAHKRLRQEWVVQWLYNPQWIQPGTNMPQLFGGGNSAFKDYPDEQKKVLEEKFGNIGEGQIRLLVDALYDLGARNETVTQPPAPAEAAPAAEAAGAGQEAAPAQAEDEFGESEKPKAPASAPADAKPAEGSAPAAAEEKKEEKKEKNEGGDDFEP